jgi:hypothetical protein
MKISKEFAGQDAVGGQAFIKIDLGTAAAQERRGFVMRDTEDGTSPEFKNAPVTSGRRALSGFPREVLHTPPSMDTGMSTLAPGGMR